MGNAFTRPAQVPKEAASLVEVVAVIVAPIDERAGRFSGELQHPIRQFLRENYSVL